MKSQFITPFNSLVTTILLGSFFLLGLLSAHAQSCTTLFPSGEAAPGGYGASWNPFSNARELLLAGTCNGDTVAVTIGSDQPNQYVFNQSFHWNGTEWRQIPLQGSSAPVGNWIPRQGKGSFNKGNQNPAIFVGYVCQYSGNTWRCGCADQACSAPRWQVQALQTQTGGGGGGGVGTGPQCAGATPPAPAAQHGLTKLAFCEDFSDPTKINLGTTLEDGQSFTQVSSGNIFGSAPMPASAFSFSNGVMSVKPTRNNYQVNMISTVPTGGGKYKGFALTGSGWYAEIRWKHAACDMSTAFPAFWSMDLGHLYGSKFPILEPDFYEYIGKRYIGAIHNWAGSGNKTATLSTIQGMPVDPTQFFVAGAMAEPNNAAYAWYLNDKQMERKTAAWLSMFSTFASPIMFGSGPNCPYDVDYIRAWTKP